MISGSYKVKHFPKLQQVTFEWLSLHIFTFLELFCGKEHDAHFPATERCLGLKCGNP